MAGKVQAIRGMHDVLPGDSGLWQYLEKTVREVVGCYGYREIRFPIVEMTDLFKRSIGEVTDIVEKEMYTFEDRNGDSLTMRPEGTAGCVRACIENGLLHNQIQRLWYQGPMFRHERPQKGRYRQFHQVGVETYGLPGPDIDLELILMTNRLWQALGLDGLELQINTLGIPAERAAYRDVLIDYLRSHEARLDADSRRRLESNPLRVLDSKNPDMQGIIEEAPALADYLGDESRHHFETLCGGLEAAGISYRVNPRLVRGLDYYVLTVFEWVTTALGAQGTVCAGGRYDGLVEQLGGRSTPACGFAMGMERLIALLEDNPPSEAAVGADVYIVAVGEQASRHSLTLSETLRDQLPGRRVLTNCGGGGFKAQFKRADRSGAEIAVVLGDDELGRGEAGVKMLRQGTDQKQVDLAVLGSELASILGASQAPH